MLPEVLLFLSLTLAVHSGTSSGATSLDLIFSFITSFGRFGFNASGVVPAVDIALEHINSHPDLLAGYKLGYLSVRDSEVSVYIYNARAATGIHNQWLRIIVGSEVHVQVHNDDMHYFTRSVLNKPVAKCPDGVYQPYDIYMAL